VELTLSDRFPLPEDDWYSPSEVLSFRAIGDRND
jgi:hypothetical protein